jgi:hypothetical protein
MPHASKLFDVTAQLAGGQNLVENRGTVEMGGYAVPKAFYYLER